jgi:hypothetical protein
MWGKEEPKIRRTNRNTRIGLNPNRVTSGSRRDEAAIFAAQVADANATVDIFDSSMKARDHGELENEIVKLVPPDSNR